MATAVCKLGIFFGTAVFLTSSDALSELELISTIKATHKLPSLYIILFPVILTPSLVRYICPPYQTMLEVMFTCMTNTSRLLWIQGKKLWSYNHMSMLNVLETFGIFTLKMVQLTRISFNGFHLTAAATVNTSSICWVTVTWLWFVMMMEMGLVVKKHCL